MRRFKQLRLRAWAVRHRLDRPLQPTGQWCARKVVPGPPNPLNSSRHSLTAAGLTAHNTQCTFYSNSSGVKISGGSDMCSLWRPVHWNSRLSALLHVLVQPSALTSCVLVLVSLLVRLVAFLIGSRVGGVFGVTIPVNRVLRMWIFKEEEPPTCQSRCR